VAVAFDADNRGAGAGAELQVAQWRADDGRTGR
jgi:hypothetical protein